MTLSVTWQGRDDHQTYLVGDPGTKVTFALDEGAQRELELLTGEDAAAPVTLVITRTVRGKVLVDSVPWPKTDGHFVSLEYRLQASQVVQYEAVLVAPYSALGGAADGKPLRFAFIPTQQSSFSRAFLLASLAALVVFFAPLLTRLGGGFHHDLLFTWGTPLVAALVAFLRTELLNTRTPPLLGIFLYPLRAAIAVACAWGACALFAWLSLTAVTNDTPSPITLADGASRVPIAPNETVVFLFPAPRSTAFWDAALGRDDKLHCLAQPGWPKDCQPHPGGEAPARLRLAKNVVVHCRAKPWEGWKEADKASFQHAIRSGGGVWLEPGPDCKTRDDATVTLTQTANDGTVEVTAKYPWRASAEVSESNLALELEDRRQTPNVVARRFKMTKDRVCPTQSGGTYAVQLASSTGQKQELGVLKCAPDAGCVRKIPFKVAALSELTLEQDASREWLSTWTVDGAGRGTQTTGFVCEPQKDGPLRLVVTVATAQEPSDLELNVALAVKTLEVKSSAADSIVTIGEGTCAGMESPTWHGWRLGDSSNPELIQRARLQQGEGSVSIYSEWHRSPTLSSDAGLGFRSAWLCGSVWALAEVNGKKADPPKPWQLVLPKKQETTCQLSQAAVPCPPDTLPTGCGDKKPGREAGRAGCDWVQICECKRR